MQNGKFQVSVDAAQVVAFVYRNPYMMFLWQYAYILLPLFVFTGTLLFRLIWCLLAGTCGLTRRVCNIATFFAFVSMLVLMSLLFLGIYPILATED
jgi:uncharacterized phage infection (PIP) family protein YhgE